MNLICFYDWNDCGFVHHFDVDMNVRVSECCVIQFQMPKFLLYLMLFSMPVECALGRRQ